MWLARGGQAGGRCWGHKLLRALLQACGGPCSSSTSRATCLLSVCQTCIAVKPACSGHHIWQGRRGGAATGSGRDAPPPPHLARAHHALPCPSFMHSQCIPAIWHPYTQTRKVGIRRGQPGSSGSLSMMVPAAGRGGACCPTCGAPGLCLQAGTCPHRAPGGLSHPLGT